MPARPLARTASTLAVALAALAGCSYTEATPDAASRTTAPAPGAVGDPAAGGPVIGTLPPITIPGTLPLPPPGAADDAAPLPPDTAAPPDEQAAESVPPDTAAPVASAPTSPPPTTPAPAPAGQAAGAPMAVQVGSFSVRDGATRMLEELAGAGFPGFGAEGSGPFRVVRAGLSEPDARTLREQLAAAGYESFLVRP